MLDDSAVSEKETGMTEHVVETRIVWLRPKDNYEYLREGIWHCGQRVRFPLKQCDPAKWTDGGPLSHLVAYAVVDIRVPRDECGYFLRRYWWVKGYDRFEGHGNCRGFWYRTGAPCEAVDVMTIIPGVRSESYT